MLQKKQEKAFNTMLFMSNITESENKITNIKHESIPIVDMPDIYAVRENNNLKHLHSSYQCPSQTSSSFQ
jgi:hypothetical protein